MLTVGGPLHLQVVLDCVRTAGSESARDPASSIPLKFLLQVPALTSLNDNYYLSAKINVLSP